MVPKRQSEKDKIDFLIILFLIVCYTNFYWFLKKPHKGTKKISYTQINNVRARLFLPNISIFTHFFLISAHSYAKKAVILQRELISGIASVEKQEHLTQK